MFVDRVRLTLRAGKGGDGIVAWRREKYIPKGGPCGGNGGRGGSVIIEGSDNSHSLEHLVNRPILCAENGQPGGPNRRQGRLGKNLTITVPFGTLIKDTETGAIVHDICPETPKVTLCTGGRGGLGNFFFKTPTRQAPTFCTLGKRGEELSVELELKLIADIGLVGLPNAGKSTLFSSLTNAFSKAADYPFTTLQPRLSFIEYDDYSRLYIADIPGIIEDAHQNRGLGLEFLRHIERTKFLFFVIDITSPDPIKDFLTLRNEIESYSSELAAKPFITLLNKTDLLENNEPIEAFRNHQGSELIFSISAFTGDQLETLTESLRGKLSNWSSQSARPLVNA